MLALLFVLEKGLMLLSRLSLGKYKCRYFGVRSQHQLGMLPSGCVGLLSKSRLYNMAKSSNTSSCFSAAVDLVFASMHLINN